MTKIYSILETTFHFDTNRHTITNYLSLTLEKFIRLSKIWVSARVGEKGKKSKLSAVFKNKLWSNFFPILSTDTIFSSILYMLIGKFSDLFITLVYT